MLGHLDRLPSKDVIEILKKAMHRYVLRSSHQRKHGNGCLAESTCPRTIRRRKATRRLALLCVSAEANDHSTLVLTLESLNPRGECFPSLADTDRRSGVDTQGWCELNVQ